MEYKEFARKIKEIRKNHNISQEDIAKILDIDRTTYNHYENDYQTIPLKHLNNFCNYFNVSIDYIFNLTTIPTYINCNNEISINLFALRLKEFRKDTKITQAKLAMILNTNQSVIANYERGRNIIATPFLYTICNSYNISADYLLGKTDAPKYL